jgi:membrane associated rhomboid family serine protease
MLPLHDTVPTRHPPLALWTLILLNGLFFWLELALGPGRLEQFFYLFGVVPARFAHPAWAAWEGFPHSYWPFLTAMFLHAGWLHILGNMWFLWVFGRAIEDRMGPARFLIFYLLCGVVASVVQVITMPNATVPTVGASGAIAGVMGAYLWLYPRSRIVTLVPIFFWPFFLEIPAVVFLVVWFAIQFWSGALALAGPQQVGGVAFWAHVGGFGAGLLIHPLFLIRGTARRRPEADEAGIAGIWRRTR